MKYRFEKTSRRARIGLAVVAIVILGAGAALTFLDDRPQGAVEIKPGVKSVISREPAEKPEVAVAMPAPAAISKSDEFFRLTKTGNATDAYQAYRLAADCASTQAWQTLLKQSPTDLSSRQFSDYMASLPKVEEVCGNLSPGQIASRKQYIVKAALAGVHGAFNHLITAEGPHGILHSFDDDDEWKALELAALQASLKTADPAALFGRSAFLSNCSDAPEAICKSTQATKAESISLLVAARDARALEQGKPMPPAIDPDRYAPGLPPEVAKKAIADGHILVVTAQRPQ